MTAVARLDAAASRWIPDARWRRHLGWLGAAALLWAVLFARDIGHMVSIWWNVSTYNHGIFIPPIVAWLIWMRRDEVARIAPGAWAPGLVPLALAGGLWLVGDAAGIATFRHAAVIGMAQSLVLALLGPNVTRALLFPLFYMVFMIPFGDELVPQLQTITARMAMLFLGWAGIPAHIEGVFISIPTGYFEVAEACSGVKFLVAMLALGVLAANLCFKSTWRRAAFMAMAVTVPVLANGLRAYGTIHVSYLTSNDFAASFDHIIFGWFFFAAVMALVLAIGWPFFDRRVDDRWLGEWTERPAAFGNSPLRRGFAAVAALLLVLPAGWSAGMAALGRQSFAAQAQLPQIPGWKQVKPVQSWPWKPPFAGADQYLHGQYVDGKGRRVDLVIVLFAWQHEGKELVGYGRGAFDPASRWSWANDTAPPPGGRAERIFAPGVQREVASFYVLGDHVTGSGGEVKLRTIRARILGGDQAAAALLVSAEPAPGVPARVAIDAMLSAVGEPRALAVRLLRQARGG